MEEGGAREVDWQLATGLHYLLSLHLIYSKDRMERREKF